MDLRKICIRLTMQMGTSYDYFMSLTLRQLLLLVKDFIEVNNEDAEARRKAVKKK